MDEVGDVGCCVFGCFWLGFQGKSMETTSLFATAGVTHCLLSVYVRSSSS